MNDLERLIAPLDEHASRGVRLGYALGIRHSLRTGPRDLPPHAPEFRVLDDLGLGQAVCPCPCRNCGDASPGFPVRPDCTCQCCETACMGI